VKVGLPTFRCSAALHTGPRTATLALVVALLPHPIANQAPLYIDCREAAISR